MPANTLKTLDVGTLEEWRQWLTEHHASQSEVWLVFYKRNAGRASINYADAIDEALCFGWVDSLVKRLDGVRYARKFTPRQPHSKWSTANRNRYAQLREAGRLLPGGLNRSPTSRSGDALRPSLTEIPPYIRDALNQRPSAGRFFQGLAPSYRRNYITWIDSARREETKAKRLQEALRLLAAGKKLGLK